MQILYIGSKKTMTASQYPMISHRARRARSSKSGKEAGLLSIRTQVQ